VTVGVVISVSQRSPTARWSPRRAGRPDRTAERGCGGRRPFDRHHSGGGRGVEPGTPRHDREGCPGAWQGSRCGGDYVSECALLGISSFDLMDIVRRPPTTSSVRPHSLRVRTLAWRGASGSSRRPHRRSKRKRLPSRWRHFSRIGRRDVSAIDSVWCHRCGHRSIRVLPSRLWTTVGGLDERLESNEDYGYDLTGAFANRGSGSCSIPTSSACTTPERR